MENVAQAIEALKSYDLEDTKQALRYLIREGELCAIEHVLPLTQHPDVALRYFAKRALRILRDRVARSTPPSASSGDAAARETAPSPAPRVAEWFPRRSELEEPEHRRPSRPEFFRIDVVI